MDSGNLTLQEANKIIAEYMNNTFLLDFLDLKERDSKNKKGVLTMEKMELAMKYHGIKPKMYFESLDALVPVWEKLGKVNFFFSWYKDEWEFTLTNIKKLGNPDYEGIRELGTLQEAACLATAKAIKELD